MVECDEVINQASIEAELGGGSTLRIAEVHVSPMIDSLGEEALRVVVVFDPSVTVEDFASEEMLRISNAIHAVARRQPAERYRFPYDRFLSYEDWLLDRTADLDDEPAL